MRYLFLCLCLLFHTSGFTETVGTLRKQGSDYYLDCHNLTLRIKSNKSIMDEIRSLVKFDTFVQFKQGIIKDSVLTTTESPMLSSGIIERRGYLKQINGTYFIDDDMNNPVIFNETKPCFGTQFDESSRDYYLNKAVIALTKSQDGNNVITAIIEEDLYSITPHVFTADSKAQSVANKKSMAHLLSWIFKPKQSKYQPSFKVTMLNRKPVQTGSKALVITLGGLAADDLESLGGHFTLGQAEVMANGQLDMEMFNFYPRFKEKSIIPGHCHYIDFFGGIMTGQSNYRPNYTLIVYGVSDKKLKKIREVMGMALTYMRSSNDPGGGTHNCTTSVWVALNAAGISGRHKPLSQRLLPPYFPEGTLSYRYKKYTTLKTLHFLLKNGYAEGSPRLAFISLIQELKVLKPDRIDFIFQQQRPSERARGLAPIDDITDYLWSMKQKKVLDETVQQYGLTGKKAYRLKWVERIINERLAERRKRS